MDPVATIKEAWGWAGVSPVQIVGDNSVVADAEENQ
jgi:hypothetical protein